MNTPNKIALVDDHPLILQGISELISSHFPQTQIIECCSGIEFITTSLTEKPDMLIVDLLLPDVSGIHAVSKIKQELPCVKVIFLSGFKDPIIEQKCFYSGGDVLLSKENAPKELISYVKKLFHPAINIQHSLATENKQTNNHTNTKLLGFEFEVFNAKLTRQQKKLFSLIGEGKERRDIVKICNITGNTFDKHCQNIKHKLELKSSHELMMLAFSYCNYLQQTKRL